MVKTVAVVLMLLLLVEEELEIVMVADGKHCNGFC